MIFLGDFSKVIEQRSQKWVTSPKRLGTTDEVGMYKNGK